MTGEASRKLTELFQYPIPQRWSIAHLYQAILKEEEHVPQIDYMITLEGYVHWKLTGKKVLGIGDVAGMFPADMHTHDFDQSMIEKFDALIAEKAYPWKLRDILPKALTAGEDAGELTEEGARLLDPSGTLQAKIPLCPPEGDAGTGMTATNSVRVRTGNVSAGTSVFAMVVLEHELKKSASGNRSGHHTFRRSGGYGALQQLYFGFECMGGTVWRICPCHGNGYFRRSTV